MLFKSILLSAGIVVASVCGASALSTTSANPKDSVTPTVLTIACKGYNRNYRDFNHCMQVNGQANLAYCSRICSGG